MGRADPPWILLLYLNFILNFPWKTFDIRTVEAYQILYCLQYSRPPSVFVKYKNHFFATMCWDKVRPVRPTSFRREEYSWPKYGMLKTETYLTSEIFQM